MITIIIITIFTEDSANIIYEVINIFVIAYSFIMASTYTNKNDDSVDDDDEAYS